LPHRPFGQQQNFFCTHGRRDEPNQRSRHKGLQERGYPTGDPQQYMSTVMMSAISIDLILVAVVFAMVMAGFLAAAPE
jgi:hypothetical protein